MRITNRFEYKYVLDLRTYFAFKNRLSLYMKKGLHTDLAQNKQYFVRSLYYDTYDFKHYYESEDGQFGRIKCRVRTYHKTQEEANIISIEIKTKHGANVKKYSQLIPIEDYLYFLKNHCFQKSSMILDEFTRLIHLQQLEAKAIVEYEREGYVPKISSDLRITFDHSVRSGASKELFPEEEIALHQHNQMIVCEIKCGMKKPQWLEMMIKEFGLKLVGNSKYIQAISRMYPSIISRLECSNNLKEIEGDTQ
ncbi:polyphosphate polymerase domain-containing protein [Hujiaoplasma nucleasis]|uniref:Polyphosphate polymerase domain-containing protein n=1 Tax=Hujiaoplasma nucleasis TaxID=2725268 RepID=A0A7L6N8F1_9MOLU|nr:polyphosphate polymerase domain-containing protein [Hujiaoplasma nucleasis]QLY40799.1 polyphosphate polymerase domain-containing protein [Hujiaoplasma nucleasis]